MIVEIAGLYFLFVVINNLLQSSETVHLFFTGVIFTMQQAIILLLLLFLFKFLFSIYTQRFQIKYCFESNRKITSHLIKYFYSLKPEVYKSGKISDTLNKIFTIGGFFSELIQQPVIVFFTEVILSILILTSLFVFNYKILLLLIVILLPISYFLLHKSRIKLKKTGDNLMNNNVDYHQAVSNLINGIFDIKLAGTFNHFYNEFYNKISQLHQTKKVIVLENSFPQKVFEFAIILGIAVLFFISNQLENYQDISSLVAAFATASFRIVPSINRIISSINNLKIYKNYIDFIHEALKHDYIYEENNEKNSTSISSIELKNISFSYSSLKVIEDFSLKLLQSEIVGITGASGTGKSTLVNIISGLLEPQSGSILVNKELITEKIRNNIIHKTAFVTQEPFFFNGTVAQNISFGLPESKEILMWSINSVNMNSWVASQPDGINTQIGDMGYKLSGGQKQRLAIARAIYRNANLLILDEPSNSLDNENKIEIISLIEKLTVNENLITVIVSHDDYILNKCNRVIKFGM
ncbi:MAG: ABC transporter ATP-binding protein [Bacteroidetes bacterium]|nr:ABC transporter ATP-binding protein [Bacteroidota bacterium]